MLTTRCGSDSIVISPNLCSIVTGNSAGAPVAAVLSVPDDPAVDSAVPGAPAVSLASAVAVASAAPALSSSLPQAASASNSTLRIGIARLVRFMMWVPALSRGPPVRRHTLRGC